jgi:peroxiredoxin Q/BCP
MKSLVLGLVLSAALVFPASAMMKAGDVAPNFTLQASLDGKDFTFTLADALKKGPVVLYFYPAAFTKGCTVEAHEFAASIDRFKALGAGVYGISHDKIATLDKFSVSECQSKFPVIADEDGAVMKSYDTVLSSLLGYANRTSYVIAPDGHILYVYTDLDPDHHVENTLHAIETWKAGQK